MPSVDHPVSFDALQSLGALGTAEAPIDGRYVVTREIARGGMGVVLAATHVRANREVALKMLLPAWSGNAEARPRVAREAFVLGALVHPLVVEILDAGVLADGSPYFAMERLEGRTLEGLLAASGAFPQHVALALARDVAEALVVVHRRGVVHRDIKPANVFVLGDVFGHGCVRLIDFGIACFQHSATSITSPGEVIGTAGYMPPEQRGGEALDARADVYAATATLFECLTGESPSQRPLPLPPRADDVFAHLPYAGKELASLLADGLALDAERRIPNAVALLQRIDSCLAEAAKRGPFPGTPSRDLDVEQRAAALGSRAVHHRRHSRRCFVTPVRLVLGDGRTITGRTEELSESGVLVRVAACEALVEPMFLEMRIAHSATSTRVPVVVRWRRTSPRWTVLGLEFEVAGGRTPDAFAQYARTLVAGTPFASTAPGPAQGGGR